MPTHDSSLPTDPSPPIIILDGFDLSSLRLKDDKGGMQISGQGSMLCFHFAGESAKSLKALLWHHLLENGTYIAQQGFMALNLDLTDAHIESFLKALEQFVMKYKQALS